MYALEYYGHASGAAEFFQSIQNSMPRILEGPSFLNTHPSTDNRVQLLTDLEEQHSGEKKSLPIFVQDYAKTGEIH